MTTQLKQKDASDLISRYRQKAGVSAPTSGPPEWDGEFGLHLTTEQIKTLEGAHIVQKHEGEPREHTYGKTINVEEDGAVKATTVTKRDYSAKEREALVKEGKAMSDGSFPIVDRQDVVESVALVGLASDQTAAKAHIIKRAKEIQATDALPADWDGSTKDETKTVELEIEIKSTGHKLYLSDEGDLVEEKDAANKSQAVEINREDGGWKVQCAPDTLPIAEKFLTRHEVTFKNGTEAGVTLVLTSDAPEVNDPNAGQTTDPAKKTLAEEVVNKAKKSTAQKVHDLAKAEGAQCTEPDADDETKNLEPGTRGVLTKNGDRLVWLPIHVENTNDAAAAAQEATVKALTEKVAQLSEAVEKANANPLGATKGRESVDLTERFRLKNKSGHSVTAKYRRDDD